MLGSDGHANTNIDGCSKSNNGQRMPPSSLGIPDFVLIVNLRIYCGLDGMRVDGLREVIVR